MIVVLKVTKSCNLRCQYCYMDILDTTPIKIMGLDVVSEIIKKFGSKYPSVDYSWHGGEPTLAGIKFYQEVVDLQKEFYSDRPDRRYKNSFQSNGILFNETWLDFSKQNNFSIGFSYDGHENGDGKGRMFINQFSSGPVFRQMVERWYLHGQYSPGVICVVSKNNVNQAIKIYNEFKKLRISSFSLLPYQGQLTELRITPDDFFDFHKEMFNCWANDDSENRFSQIVPFSTIMSSLIGDKAHLCSWDGRCFSDMVAIEPDGGVYLCSSLFGADHKLGNIVTETLDQIFSSDNYKRAIDIQNRVLDLCKECEVFDVCMGGCREAALFTFGSLEHKDPNCEGRRRLVHYIMDQCLDSVEALTHQTV